MRQIIRKKYRQHKNYSPLLFTGILGENCLKFDSVYCGRNGERSASIFRVEVEDTGEFVLRRAEASVNACQAECLYAGYCSTLMMETARLSETPVNIHHFT